MDQDDAWDPVANFYVHAEDAALKVRLRAIAQTMLPLLLAIFAIGILVLWTRDATLSLTPGTWQDLAALYTLGTYAVAALTVLGFVGGLLQVGLRRLRHLPGPARPDRSGAKEPSLRWMSGWRYRSFRAATLPLAPLGGVYLTSVGWPTLLAYLTSTCMYLLPEVAAIMSLRGQRTLYRLSKFADISAPKDTPEI